jgi:hypothetical protein
VKRKEVTDRVRRIWCVQGVEASVPIARGNCERSVGTVFQLPNPDAIYSQDEEKEKKAGRHLVLFVFVHNPRAAEAR